MPPDAQDADIPAVASLGERSIGDYPNDNSSLTEDSGAQTVGSSASSAELDRRAGCDSDRQMEESPSPLLQSLGAAGPPLANVLSQRARQPQMPPVVWYFPHVGRVALLLPERDLVFLTPSNSLFVASVLCREFIIRQCPLHSRTMERDPSGALGANPDYGNRPAGRRRAEPGAGGAGRKGWASFCGRDTNSVEAPP